MSADGPATCTNCGGETADQEFCANCGQRLRGDPPSRARRNSEAALAWLAFGLIVLSCGCVVGGVYGVCWGVSFLYPPMRDGLWQWTLLGLVLLVVLYVIDTRVQVARRRVRVAQPKDDQA